MNIKKSEKYLFDLRTPAAAPRIRRIRKSAGLCPVLARIAVIFRKKGHLPVFMAVVAVAASSVVMINMGLSRSRSQATQTESTISEPVITSQQETATTSASTQEAAATSAPTPIPSPEPDPALRRGDVSTRVQELQQRLMNLGYLDIDETTLKFGPATELAVSWFQRQHGLPQTGEADGETLALIYSDQAKHYTLLEGTRGSDVDSLQRRLIALGYMNKATGYYGTETLAAVKAFQKQNRLAVDGKTGEKTLNLLYSPKAKLSPQLIAEKRRAANISVMLDVAVRQVGKPYAAGQEGPKSFDCSGFVYYCLRQAGSNIGRYNAAGYSEVDDWEKIKSISSLQKGDLLFFWDRSRGKVGHVAIYIGSGMMIDASSSHGEVVKRSFTADWCKDLFVWARRPW